MVEEGKQTPGQASDVSMGATLPAQVSYAPKSTEERPGYSTPYPSASSGDAAEKSLGTSPLRPAKFSSTFSQPSTSTQMVRFKKQVPATVELRQNREQKYYIFDVEGAECIDQAAQHLIFCYILKIVMTVKWRLR